MKTTHNQNRIHLSPPLKKTAPLAALMLGAAVFSASPTQAAEDFSIDDLWNFATLYKDDSNHFLQEFKLRGRYQGQYHHVDSDLGTTDGWEDRRSRFGFDAKLFDKQIEVRADFQSNDGFQEFYTSLVDAYVKWKPSSTFSLTAGRLKPQIGYYDFLQSTNAQPTFERSQIFNQLRVDRVTGIVAEGKAGKFTWQSGAYSNEVNREFGTFKGSYSYGAGVGYDLKEELGWKRADVRLDWIHSGHDADDTQLNRYDNIVSATFWGQNGPWGAVFETFFASGAEGRYEDVAGFYILPTYDVTKKLQIVGRYSFATGDGLASLDGQSRYEREPTGSAQGSQYHAFYLGGQCFINGDKLKLLAGAEYATLAGGPANNDYEGLTFLSGIRFSF